MHFDLLAGDWDFWIDWKDRQWWVTVTPMVSVMYPGAVMYYFWTFYRQPFGATLCLTGLLVGKWITIVFAWYWWANFPMNFVMPATMVPSALILDCVLLLTRSWMLTAIFGVWAFAMIFYPENYFLFGYSKQPLVADGQLLSLADYMGFTYVRTGTPEYIRIIEVGSLRTFGGHTVWISAFFSAFASMLIYTIWWQMGHFFGTAYFWVKGKRGKLTRTNDVMIVGTDEFAVTHGAIPNAGLPLGITMAEGKS
jgi:methane/ammonia monooxygenase subunit A